MKESSLAGNKVKICKSVCKLVGAFIFLWYNRLDMIEKKKQKKKHPFQQDGIVRYMDGK